MTDQQLFQKITEKQIDDKYLDKKFDPITIVVDTLTSPTPLKQSFNKLQELNLFLDQSINLLARQRTSLFNNLLYAY